MSNRVCSVFVKLTVLSTFVATAAAAGCGGGNGGSGTGSSGGTNGTPGGMTSSAGTTATGSPTSSTGGTPGTDGTTTVEGLVGNGAEWPMPNSQVDVASGAPNPQSYTDNGDGTVTDNVTGLMWQQAASPNTYTWADAVAYCPTLALAGHSDWRLPLRIELLSIVDVGHRNPSIDGTYFPSTPADYFWSASPVAGSPSYAWIVFFLIGHSEYNFTVSDSGFARCVRSASAQASSSIGRYTAAGGTVYDHRTGLTWQRSTTLTEYTWVDAKTHCGGLGTSLGGSGWRLPTVKELQTIVDDSRVNPSIDPTAFPAASSYDFWSSSPLVGLSDAAWEVRFDKGNSYQWFVSSTYEVRCVR